MAALIKLISREYRANHGAEPALAVREAPTANMVRHVI